MRDLETTLIGIQKAIKRQGVVRTTGVFIHSRSVFCRADLKLVGSNGWGREMQVRKDSVFTGPFDLMLHSLYETFTPFRAVVRNSYNTGSHHSKRVPNQPVLTGLLSLPPEAISRTTDFLPLDSAASLAFCNRTLSKMAMVKRIKQVLHGKDADAGGECYK